MKKYILGDTVSLKKPHACNFNEWQIKRTGVDIKLECMGCHKQVWLTRIEFEKRLRKIKDEDGKFVSIVNFERKDMELD